MPDDRIFQWLHRHLHQTRSFHGTRYDVDQRRPVHNTGLEEIILNVVADRRVKYESCCSSHKSPLHSIRHHTLHNSFCNLLRLNVVYTSAFAHGLHNSEPWPSDEDDTGAWNLSAKFPTTPTFGRLNLDIINVHRPFLYSWSSALERMTHQPQLRFLDHYATTTTML
ncbi:hypothetical protein TNCV_2467581 [Trichonephila clavipes]|nr:hypothetical protein TNCV_2467581 [Trichonephila clavipes]